MRPFYEGASTLYELAWYKAAVGIHYSLLYILIHCIYIVYIVYPYQSPESPSLRVYATAPACMLASAPVPWRPSALAVWARSRLDLRQGGCSRAVQWGIGVRQSVLGQPRRARADTLHLSREVQNLCVVLLSSLILPFCLCLLLSVVLFQLFQYRHNHARAALFSCFSLFSRFLALRSHIFLFIVRHLSLDYG